MYCLCNEHSTLMCCAKQHVVSVVLVVPHYTLYSSSFRQYLLSISFPLLTFCTPFVSYCFFIVARKRCCLLAVHFCLISLGSICSFQLFLMLSPCSSFQAIFIGWRFSWKLYLRVRRCAFYAHSSIQSMNLTSLVVNLARTMLCERKIVYSGKATWNATSADAAILNRIPEPVATCLRK